MSADRYADRRADLLGRLGETIAIVPAGRQQRRNDDVSHPFRQDSDFFFLTGFAEPEAVAVLDATSDEPYTLFVLPRDPEIEAWTGLRTGTDGARERYGADAAHEVGHFRAWLRRRLVGRRSVAYVLGGPIDDDVLGAIGDVRRFADRAGVGVPLEVVDLRAYTDELRLHKSEAEVAALREACRISALAHREAMRFAAPGRTERQVQAALEYVFGVLGSERVGYGSIVAGGASACILHYVDNEATLVDGDLLLVDAGAEVRHLTADITRTFPVNGRFDGPQRALYEVVLRAQQAVIAACWPGLPVTELHARSVAELADGLVTLGLLPGPAEEVVAKGWYRQFFFHGTSHWLGIDVHDAGAGRVEGVGRPLAPGMAFTVEPGLYVGSDKATVTLSHATYDPDERLRLAHELGATEAKAEIARRDDAAGTFVFEVPAAFLGLGVRIEDDLLVTAAGVENLTALVPVEPDEVETLCAESSALPLFD